MAVKTFKEALSVGPGGISQRPGLVAESRRGQGRRIQAMEQDGCAGDTLSPRTTKGRHPCAGLRFMRMIL